MKNHRIKIIADINRIYSDDVEEIKDLTLQLSGTGIDAVTLDWYMPKDDSEEEKNKRVTKRELYILKAFSELANIEFIPLLDYYQLTIAVVKSILEELKIERYLCRRQDGVCIFDIEDKEKAELFVANSVPINPFPVFDLLNYYGFVDNTEGIATSIVAMVKGALCIVKPVITSNDDGIGMKGLMELSDFRNSIKRILA